MKVNVNAVLVRHTRVVVPAGLCYGRCDVPLAETFAQDAAGVVATLPWIPRVVWTSPATRCLRLAERLEAPELRVDTRLAELHMGAWEGRRWDELSSPELDAWFADPWTARPPSGETAPELLQRVGELRAELSAASHDRLVVVTHAGVIRAWRSLAENRPLAALFEEKIPFGSIWRAEL